MGSNKRMHSLPTTRGRTQSLSSLHIFPCASFHTPPSPTPSGNSRSASCHYGLSLSFVEFYMKHFLNCFYKSVIDTQSYDGFKYTTQWFLIHPHYQVCTPSSVVTIYQGSKMLRKHEMYSLCCTTDLVTNLYCDSKFTIFTQ